MALIAKNIGVRVEKKVLLRDVTFDAQPGAVTAIVGPSGAGKSTLLSAVSGDVAYTGSVSLNGQDIKSIRASVLAHHRAVLAQATPLAFPFTVFEIVRLGLQRHTEPKIAAHALQKVGMAGFEGQYYQSLSGGEQQRVQLARVLCQVWQPVEDGVPRWLFLDEPVSSLDIGQQLRVMQTARDFADQGGGVVVVMHDLNLTAMFADRVALVVDGALVVQDSVPKALTAERLTDAYGCDLKVCEAPISGFFTLPQLARVYPSQELL
ncbi:heme ABC transporter ATP-binding protein [uncultured Shimia sp.]|uniref:heme ABC transporter ATP-binding protein n=1 Tax=uncultured Shimia sp. TaxID=573152 RepID=UPI00260D06A3|nr:heme ABC transporter ATP-binding protein [uncultured Shimia sp.]